MEGKEQIVTRPMHLALGKVSWLLGKWKSLLGKGCFPTIEPFEYFEEIEFCSFGQPMFNYSAMAWHSIKKTPMHMERGFLRVKPDSNEVSLVVAHNFGVTTIEQGSVNGQEICFKSTAIMRDEFAKSPAVVGTERLYKLENGQLHYTMRLATDKTPMTDHLYVVYERYD